MVRGGYLSQCSFGEGTRLSGLKPSGTLGAVEPLEDMFLLRLRRQPAGHTVLELKDDNGG